MGKILIVLCLALVAAGTTFGEGRAADAPEGYPSIAEIVKSGGCAPKDDMARILKSANPLDLASNWSKTNYVGTSWTFMPKPYVVTELDGGIFLQGDLISPRGGTTDTNVFVLFNEWDCGS
ncbi:MAG: hypothetical protein ACM3MH_03055 [Actinomycetota bacterium]